MSAAVLARPAAELHPGPRPAQRHIFVVEAAEGGEVLLRVLGAVAVQQARVTALSFAAAGARATARLEIEGLDAQRADHLRRRLGQLPAVSAVAMGWRT